MVCPGETGGFLRKKTDNLKRDQYGFLFAAARCAELIYAAEHGSEGPVELRLEYGSPSWDDLFELRREASGARSKHAWQVKRQLSGLDVEEMKSLLRGLASSDLDFGHLALYALESIAKVGPLRVLADLCRRTREPGVDLTYLQRDMTQDERSWLRFGLDALGTSDPITVLKLFSRLEVTQSGTEEQLTRMANQTLRNFFERPEAILVSLKNFLQEHPDGAVPITYQLLREQVLKDKERPLPRRGVSQAEAREQYLHAVLQTGAQFVPLRALMSFDMRDGTPIRLSDIFVLPLLHQVTERTSRIEEQEGEAPRSSRATRRPMRRSSEERHEDLWRVPAPSVDLTEWLRNPEKLQAKPVFLVEGAVGSGKSSLLEHLWLMLANAALENPDAPLPFLVDAPALADNRLADALLQKLPDRDEWMQRLVERERCIILVDALDEVGTRDLQKVRAALDALQRREPAALVLSSRPHAELAKTFGSRAMRLRLAPWSTSDVERFLALWRQHAPEQVQALESLEGTRRMNPVHSLLSNPLTATFCVALASEAPSALRSRAALFGAITRRLFEQWAPARRQADPAMAELRWDEVVPALEQLALDSLQSHQETFSHESVLRVFRKVAPRRESVWMAAAHQKFGLLLRHGKDEYRFILRGIAEHLAGSALLALGPQALKDAARRRWAEEPLRHALGLLAERDGAEAAIDVLRTLLSPFQAEEKSVSPEDIRALLIAARSSMDLGREAHSIAPPLADALVSVLTLNTSDWIPRRVAETVRELAAAQGPCWDEVFGRLVARLKAKGSLASWLDRHARDDWRWWADALRFSDINVRKLATVRLERWVDTPEVRHCLVFELFDDVSHLFGGPVAPCLAGLTLRHATRDEHFNETVLPYLQDILATGSQLPGGSAALALRPGEAPLEQLANALQTLSKAFPFPREIVLELAASEDGRGALDAAWQNWADFKGDEFRRPGPPPRATSEKEPMPLGSGNIRHVLRAASPALARMTAADRRCLDLNDGTTLLTVLLCEEAYRQPEGVLELLEQEAVTPRVFHIDGQIALSRAAARHPALAHALLALWKRMVSEGRQDHFPGQALDGLVAADHPEAARTLVAWLEGTRRFWLPASPSLFLSAKTLRHPMVRPVACTQALEHWHQYREGEVYSGTAAMSLLVLRPAWDGATPIEKELCRLIEEGSEEALSMALSIYRFPPFPEAVRRALIPALTSRMDMADRSEHWRLISWLEWAERAGLTAEVHDALVAWLQHNSWRRYTGAAFLLPTLPPESAESLSMQLAKHWPRGWSDSVNTGEELARLGAAHPQSWLNALLGVLEFGENVFWLAVRGTPILELARVLAPRLPAQEKGLMLLRLKETLGRVELPYVNRDGSPMSPSSRPADDFLEFYFDTGE